MSLKQITRVWDHSQQKGGNRLTMLAIADNAKDCGYAFPGIETLARKTLLSPRQIIRNVQQAEEIGELIADRSLRYNRYILTVFDPDASHPYQGQQHCEKCGLPEIEQLGVFLKRHKIGNLLCEICFTQVNNPHIGIGDIMSPLNVGMIEKLRDILSPIIAEGQTIGDISAPIGDILSPIGDIATSPKPLTKNQTVKNKIYENILNQLVPEIAPATYNAFVAPMEFVALENGELIINAGDAYKRDWLEARLTSTINRLLTGQTAPEDTPPVVKFVIQ